MSSETAETGTGDDGSSETQNVAVAETNVVTSYLKNIVTILLDGEDIPLQALTSALEGKEYQENIRKFISDPQTRALFIQRHSLKGLSYFLID
jgi:dynein heavy chain 1, cytosolic